MVLWLEGSASAFKAATVLHLRRKEDIQGVPAQLSPLCFIILSKDLYPNANAIPAIKHSIDGLHLPKNSACMESVSPLVLRSLNTVKCKYFLLLNFCSYFLIVNFERSLTEALDVASCEVTARRAALHRLCCVVLYCEVLSMHGRISFSVLQWPGVSRHCAHLHRCFGQLQ